VSLWLFDAEPVMDIRTVKQKHQSRLLSLAGVLSVGIGLRDRQQVIVIGIQQESDVLRQQLPAELDGFPVVVEVIGTPQAF